MTALKFVVSSFPANLTAALEGKKSATVEAEYGDVCVTGSVLTMAHHGPRAGQMAPCAYPNGCGESVEVVGLSHIDLDTIGGCLAILGLKPELPGFWELSEFVDLNGPHKLGESGASAENLRRLYAFWAWSKEARMFPPRDGSVADVTEQVTKSAEVVRRICADDAELLQKGDAFKAAETGLNRNSFLELRDGVLVRVSDAFVNHLYVSPEGVTSKTVVAFGTVTGALTVSFADPPTGKSAVQIVQELWGKEAGGHAGIAGSPRGKRMGLQDLSDAVAATIAALR